MLIPVHLLLFGQIIHLAASNTLNPKEHHHRRHAPKNSPHIHQANHHKVNKIKTRNVIPFDQSNYGFQDLPILPNKQELIYPKHYLNKHGGQVYFIQPGVGMDSAAYNTIRKGGEFMWANEGRGLDIMGDDMPRRYFEGTREQRKLPVGEERIMRPSEELKIDTKMASQLPTSQGHLPKSDYNLLNNIITKMTPEAQNTLIDVLLRNLEDKTKTGSMKQNVVYPKAQPQLVMKQNSAQDKSALPNLLVPAHEEKHNDANGPTQLVQPFSLTVDKTKLQTLYNMLNDDKMKSHEHTNSTISFNRNSEFINEILADEIRKSNKCIKCLHYATSTTVSPKTSTTTKRYSHPTQSHMMYCQEHAPRGMDSDADSHSRIVNLTQIFNVHPRLLVVNSNLPTGGKMAGNIKRCSKPPPAKKGKETDSKKPCAKTLEPVYYVDVDDFPANQEELLIP